MMATGFVDVETMERETRKVSLEEHFRDHGKADLRGMSISGYGDDLLEGRQKGQECCCRKQIMSGMAGQKYAHFACTEAKVGQCRWRMTQEPTVLCMFRATTRTKVAGRTVEVRSCTRLEAQDEAERIFAEDAVREKTGVAVNGSDV